jgi:enoyl-CoA hydratase/crotonobetainyl-CoA hydratase
VNSSGVVGVGAERVLVEVHDFVATVTINRPAVRNAIDLETALKLESAFDRCDSDPDVRVIVLTGAGQIFCAGMDLKAFAATGERPLTLSRGAFGIVEKPPAKPLVAAVEGKALGGGLEIALCADLIVAATDSQFGLPEVTRGLVATGGGALRLPQRIPRAAAMEMILTGAPISADAARELGLVNHVVAQGQTIAEATRLARVIAANAPLAVRAAKAIVVESADWTAAEAFQRQRHHADPVRNSADAREGAAAFSQKRTPQWSNQ